MGAQLFPHLLGTGSIIYYTGQNLSSASYFRIKHAPPPPPPHLQKEKKILIWLLENVHFTEGKQWNFLYNRKGYVNLSCHLSIQLVLFFNPKSK